MPLPLAAQERLGQILQMLPTFSLVIVAPTGGKEMKMGMVLPIATMRVEDCEVASPQCFAPDLTREIIEALPPAAHERTSYDRRVLVEGRAEHRWDRQDDGPIDHPLVEGLTHLVDPVVHVDFGAPQA
jgi:hypothetical protein